MKFDSGTLDKLLAKKMITQKTYDELTMAKGGLVPKLKMNDGGKVPSSLSTVPSSLSPDAPAMPPPSMLTQAMETPLPERDPFEELKAQKLSELKQKTMGIADWGSLGLDKNVPLERYAESQAVDALMGQRNAQAAKAEAQTSKVDKSVAAVKAENSKRAELGLPLLPVPAGGSGGVKPAAYQEGAMEGELAGDAGPQAQQAQDPMMSLGAAQMNALDRVGQAQIGAAQAGAAQATKENAYLDTKIKGLEKMQATTDSKEVERRAQLKDEGDRYEAAVNEYKNAPSIDPNRLFAKAETGQKIMAGFGLLLSGLSGSGNGNQAVAVIQQAIKTDIDAQKANLDKLGNYVGQKKGILAEMRARFGDDRQAEAAAKAASVDVMQVKLQQIASQYKGQEAGMRAREAAAQLDLLRIKFMGDFAEKAQARAALGQLAGGSPSEMAVQALPDEIRERYVPGYGVALTKDAGKDLNKRAATFKTLDNGFNELLSMVGNSKLSLEQKTRASVLSNMLIGQLREEVVGPGAVTDKERGIIKDIVRDPSAILSLDSNSIAALNTVRARMKDNLNNFMEQGGIKTKASKIGFKPLARR